jgi:hypothetical protein
MQRGGRRKNTRGLIHQLSAQPHCGRAIDKILKRCCHIPESRGTTECERRAVAKVIWLAIHRTIIGHIVGDWPLRFGADTGNSSQSSLDTIDLRDASRYLLCHGFG